MRELLLEIAIAIRPFTKRIFFAEIRIFPIFSPFLPFTAVEMAPIQPPSTTLPSSFSFFDIAGQSLKWP